MSFIKLKQLTFDADPKTPPKKEWIWVQAKNISSMKLIAHHSFVGTELHLGGNNYKVVEEAPEEIIKMATVPESVISLFDQVFGKL